MRTFSEALSENILARVGVTVALRAIRYAAVQKAWRERTKEIKREKDRLWRQENILARKEVEKNYRLNNADKISEKNKKHYLNNKDHYSQRTSKWARENRGKKNASHRRYAGLRRRALPKWADIKKIENIYLKAEELSRMYSVQFEVDHVVPIKSDIVCGLHCETNLQLLEKGLNRSKSNKVWPDMP